MWYVIPIAEGQELSARETCQKTFSDEGICRVFVPQYVCQKKYKGIWKEERKVLIPGWVFVDTNMEEAVEQAFHEVLRQSSEPAARSDYDTVYPEEQEFLGSIFDEADTVQMSIGDIVDGKFCIRKGPLQKKEDCIRKMNRHKRMAEIELSIHGESKRVKVGVEIVSKV